MGLSKFFRNLRLGVKLNTVVVLAFAIMLATIVVIMSRSTQNLTLHTGRHRVEQEAEVVQRRFDEAGQALLADIKPLANTPRLVEAVASKDAAGVRTIALVGAAPLDLDDIDVVDSDGAYIATVEEEGEILTAQQDTLISLALIGVDTTGVIIEEEESELWLAAAVDLRDASGAIVGALLATRRVDNEFLEESNFFREDVHLALIAHERILAQDFPTPERLGEFSAVLLEETAIGQALSGQTLIADNLLYSTDGVPYALAHTPLTVHGDTYAAIGILVDLSEISIFQRQLTINTAIVFTFLTLVTVLVVGLFAWRSISAPMHKLTGLAQVITQGNLDVEAQVQSSDEIGVLANAFNHMIVRLRETLRSEREQRERLQRAKERAEAASKALEGQIWQTAGQAQLSDKMRGEQDIPILANNVIQQLCHYLEAPIGALYVTEDSTLNLVGSYAYASKNPAKKFKFGEGLVGQTALEKQPITVTDVPDDYITVRSGLGETAPRHIMVFPFMYEDRVVGVVEMGTLTEFTPAQMDFVQTAMTNIAIAFNTAQARARIDELLVETQQQAEELQAQGEELRVTNEELEAQTESLTASEAKLKEKQAALDRQNRELKAAQQELEERAEELALTSKYKSEFLANMSHELRTPLNSLLILARMLAGNEEGNLSEEQVESAQIIYSSGDDLLNLINDILDLSKVEAGRMTFNIEPMLMTDLVATVRSQFTHVAEEKGLDLNITLADDLPASIETDQQRVKQIVKNLLSNAFKFTSEGSVSLNIYRPDAGVDLSRSGLDPSQAIAISVTDTGIGIAPEEQKTVFEAFQQADGSTSRQYDGTGLGLSISRELATRLGGQIDLESEAGQGSTFTLYLPIAGPAGGSRQEPGAEELRRVSPLQPGPPSAQPPSSPAPRPPSPPDDRAELEAGDRILLVIEDDPKFAKIVYDYAHEEIFKCLIAGDGKMGLELVKTYQPAAIILDLNLPDISGWEVLEVLKNDPGTRHIPVHIMSVDDEILDAYRKGAMGYLTKPVSPEGLAESFQRIEQFISREIRTILLVEDDAKSRRSIKKLLGGSDVQISEADGGQTALDLLKAQHFDCMILDLNLPDMTGFEVLNRMNDDEAIAKCPVIVYTGRDLTPEENFELMKYADSVIVKGVKSPDRLLDETALFLHRVVADMPKAKRQTIKKLYNTDTLLKGKKILIVDDDMRNSFALSKLLSDKGVIVKIAQTGQKALELLAENSDIDLVLMDIMMPGMDGYETTKRIRARQEFRALPILALTAKAMKGDREKCLAAGANDYLSKPVDVDRLFSMLRVWLYQ